MRDASPDLTGPSALQQCRGIHERSRRLRKIIDQEHIPPVDVADDRDGFRLGGTLAPLGNDGLWLAFTLFLVIRAAGQLILLPRLVRRDLPES